MLLSSQETTLLDAFRGLPVDTAQEISELVRRLAELPENMCVDWSDSWSDEDLRGFTARSLKRAEVDESHCGPVTWLSECWLEPWILRCGRPL